MSTIGPRMKDGYHRSSHQSSTTISSLRLFITGEAFNAVDFLSRKGGNLRRLCQENHLDTLAALAGNTVLNGAHVAQKASLDLAYCSFECLDEIDTKTLIYEVKRGSRFIASYMQNCLENIPDTSTSTQYTNKLINLLAPIREVSMNYLDDTFDYLRNTRSITSTYLGSIAQRALSSFSPKSTEHIQQQLVILHDNQNDNDEGKATLLTGNISISHENYEGHTTPAPSIHELEAAEFDNSFEQIPVTSSTEADNEDNNFEILEDPHAALKAEKEYQNKFKNKIRKLAFSVASRTEIPTSTSMSSLNFNENFSGRIDSNSENEDNFSDFEEGDEQASAEEDLPPPLIDSTNDSVFGSTAFPNPTPT